MKSRSKKPLEKVNDVIFKYEEFLSVRIKTILIKCIQVFSDIIERLDVDIDLLGEDAEQCKRRFKKDFKKAVLSTMNEFIAQTISKDIYQGYVNRIDGAVQYYTANCHCDGV